MPVWNPDAIDYSEGIDITDLVTGKVYFEEQAKQLPEDVRHRLVCKGRKIGCWVMTIEEAKEANRRRENDTKEI